MRLLSRISVRLLAFNLLLVFLPVMGFLYLDVYETQLLRAQERGMVQQGRLLSAALSDAPALDSGTAESLLARLGGRLDARLRVVDGSGDVLADSSRFVVRPPEARSDEDFSSEKPGRRRGRSSALYRLGALFYRVFYRVYARVFDPPAAPVESAEFYGSARRLAGPEVKAALEGRYGSATRVSPAGQRSVTLYSALPIRRGGHVAGAVLVSQSTYRILQDLYVVRLRLFKVFLISVAAAVLLSVLVSTTIALPLRRLRNEAGAILDRRGRLQGGFRGSRRCDEIGDLTRALQELTRRLEAHLTALESFAADLSHELRNPLSSIRTAAEMTAEVEDPAERRRFHEIVQRDVARMESLLAEVREIAAIDAGIAQEQHQRVLLGPLLFQLVESFNLRERGRVRFRLETTDGPVTVRGSPERVSQIFENLLDNAASFSPDGGEVAMTLTRRDSIAHVEVADQGRGIPPQHLDRVFDRFFTYRPGTEALESNSHSGLGLAIAAAIAEGYGGRITASNRPQGGAVFTVRLPGPSG